MVAPTGHLSLPIDLLRKTVAGSTTFQAWTGTADAAAALARVHAVQADASAAKPFAVVDWARSYSRRRDAGGTRNHFQATGSLSLLFRAQITEADAGDAAYDFLNKVGAVLADMEGLAGTAGYLDVEEIRLVEGPERPEEDEVKALGYDFYQARFEVEFRAP